MVLLMFLEREEGVGGMRKREREKYREREISM